MQVSVMLRKKIKTLTKQKLAKMPKKLMIPALSLTVAVCYVFQIQNLNNRGHSRTLSFQLELCGCKRFVLTMFSNLIT